jgi:hypothetical protein
MNELYDKKLKAALIEQHQSILQANIDHLARCLAVLYKIDLEEARQAVQLDGDTVFFPVTEDIQLRIRPDTIFTFMYVRGFFGSWRYLSNFDNLGKVAQIADEYARLPWIIKLIIRMGVIDLNDQ